MLAFLLSSNTVRANSFFLLEIPFARCDGILSLDVAASVLVVLVVILDVVVVVVIAVVVVLSYFTQLRPSSDHSIPSGSSL